MIGKRLVVHDLSGVTLWNAGETAGALRRSGAAAHPECLPSAAPARRLPEEWPASMSRAGKAAAVNGLAAESALPQRLGASTA